MYIKKEIELSNFQGWEGGSSTIEAIQRRPDANSIFATVEAILEELYLNEVPTESQVNEFFWFDLPENCVEWLGFDLWEEEAEEEEEELETNDFSIIVANQEEKALYIALLKALSDETRTNSEIYFEAMSCHDSIMIVAELTATEATEVEARWQEAQTA